MTATVAELEDKIKMYHKTLVHERQIKAELVKKLEQIKKLVSHPSLRKSKSAKRAGIPFFSTRKRGALNRETFDDAEHIIGRIRQLLFKQT